MPWDGVDFVALASVDDATWQLILVGLAGVAATIGRRWRLSAPESERLYGRLFSYLCCSTPLLRACGRGAFPRPELLDYGARQARSLSRACRQCAASNLGTAGLDLDSLPCPSCSCVGPSPSEMGMAELMDFLAVELTPLERRVVELHDLLDEPYGQVSEELGRSPDSCRKTRGRALRKLRRVLGKIGSAKRIFSPYQR